MTLIKPAAGPRNGVPLGRPYVYRGSQPYAGPDRRKQAAIGRAIGDVAAARYRERLARYRVLREDGKSVAEAAEAVGVTAKHARWKYEPELAA